MTNTGRAAPDQPLGIPPVEVHRLNAFRLTGLPVDVSTRALNLHVEKLRILENLGSTSVTPGGLLPFTPNAQQLRDAIQRLRNPEQRLVEELFWFWPSSEATAENNEALKALEHNAIRRAVKLWTTLERKNTDRVTAGHNLAVLLLTLAIDADRASLSPGPDKKDNASQESCWRASLKRWHHLLTDPAFWEFLRRRIRQIDDPRLNDTTLDMLRVFLPRTLVSAGAQFAVQAANRYDFPTVAYFVAILRSAGFPDDLVDRSLTTAVEPLRTRVNALCEATSSATEKAPQAGGTLADDLLKTSAPILAGMDRLLEESHPTLVATHDAVALCAMNTAIALGNSSLAWQKPLTVLQDAISLAWSKSARSRILTNLKIATENENWRLEGEPLATFIHSVVDGSALPLAKYVRLEDDAMARLKALQENARPDSDIVHRVSNILAGALRAISVDLHNDSERYQDALDALELAISICRDSSLREQMAGDLATVRAHAQTEAELVGLKAVRRAPSLGTVNGIGLRLIGKDDIRGSSYLTTLYFTFLYCPILPLARYRVAPAGNNVVRFLGKAPLRTGDKLHLTTVGLVVAALFLLDWLKSDGTAPTSAPVAATPAAVVADSAPAASTTPEQSSPKVDRRIAAHGQPNPGRRAATPHRTSSLSAAPREDTGLTTLGARIDAAKAQLQNMEATVTDMRAQLGRYQTSIDRDATEARQMEEQAAAGIAVDKNEYDAIVDRHNATVALHNSFLQRLRETVNTYNGLLAETNRNVARYNSRLGVR